MTNYADKLMRKYRSSVENTKEDLIEFARRSIKKSEVYLEQHMMDYEFLEMQGVDISDLRKDLSHIEKRVEIKKELLNQIYRIKDKKDIMSLRIKMIKTFGKTPILSKKKLKKIKDTAKDKEQKAKYLRWQKRQKKGSKDKSINWKGEKCRHHYLEKTGDRVVKCLECGDKIKRKRKFKKTGGRYRV